MAANVTIYLEEIASHLETFTHIRLYRDTSPTAVNSATSTLAASTLLVADQEVYEIEDADGDASSWYGYTLYEPTIPTESTLSRVWSPADTTLAVLLLEAAIECSAGFSSVCTGEGTTTTIVDAALADSAEGEGYGAGWWIWRPNANSADRLRRVTAAGLSGSSLTVSRAWASAPTEGEAYHVYMLAPPIAGQPGQPYSWAQAVNDGLRECRWTDLLNLGNGTAAGTRDFSLSPHLGYINPDRDLRAVYVRTTDSAGQQVDADMTKEGRFFQRVIDDGVYTLRLSVAPGTDQTVLAEVTRSGEQLYQLADTSTVPRRQAVLAAAWQMFEYLASNGRGEYQAQAAAKQSRLYREQRKDAAPGKVLT